MDERLLGREVELAAVDALLDRAGWGFVALVLEGEPGIGKTTAWREGVRRAAERGFAVLACRPAEAESKLSFSALTDLLEPVPSEAFAELPEPQRRALEVALLRRATDHGAVEPRAVAAGVRGVLAELATTNLLLLAVDDTQWLDAPSARALEFALRRLPDKRLALLATRRPASSQAGERLDLGDAERLELGPLSLAAVHELLKHRLGRSLPRPLLLRVHDVAQGNPFYALEIARQVIETRTGPGEPLPVPQDLSELVLRQVRRLHASTRQALLAVAVAAHPTEHLIAAALETDAGAVLEEAQEAGLVDERAGALHFTHPLYAAAVHASASRQQQRLVHRRLAEAVGEPEEHARHLALAAESPDELIATALDEAAATAKARGALDAAVELIEHAVRLTPLELADDAAERSLQLGLALRLAGDSERAGRVLHDLAERTSGSRRARALVELAAVRYWSEGNPAGVEACERALAAAKGDAALEARAHADMAAYSDMDLERSSRHAQQALHLLERQGEDADPSAHAQALAYAARASLMLGRGLPLAALERAIELESTAVAKSGSVVDRITTVAGQWLKYVDDFAGSRARLEGARQEALDEGDESALPNILMHLAQTELWSGNWRLAAQYAEESCEIAEQLEQVVGPHYRALVDAHIGRVDRARQTAGVSLEIEKRELGALLYLRVLGFLDLSLDELEQAARYLSSGLQLMQDLRILEPGVLRIHADAVEALVGVGDLERAEEVLARWEEQARRVGLAWSLATSARCRGLVEGARGRIDEALASIEEALVLHERLPMPFELGRTLLVKGQIERRAKRKGAARESLERALAIFDELGAPLWARKARAELARIGLRHAAPDELTESERRVAELAASGLTNREVAAQLFMSPKTVEANLARVYRKLGIHSRAELGARLGAEHPVPLPRVSADGEQRRPGSPIYEDLSREYPGDT